MCFAVSARWVGIRFSNEEVVQRQLLRPMHCGDNPFLMDVGLCYAFLRMDVATGLLIAEAFCEPILHWTHSSITSDGTLVACKNASDAPSTSERQHPLLIRPDWSVGAPESDPTQSGISPRT